MLLLSSVLTESEGRWLVHAIHRETLGKQRLGPHSKETYSAWEGLPEEEVI